MTYDEAMKKVRALWGRAGNARLDLGECVVGTIGALPAKVRYGRGVTWEDAFNDAQANITIPEVKEE